MTTTPIRNPIRLLPEAVATRIAAGEVIERPASVVKELVENALDAGASHIRVDIRGGGLSLIRVSDDGWGIPKDELQLAIERHATSKLIGDPTRSGPNDGLDRVVTLGFRGEALPSIAAVAELTIVSTDGTNDVGHKIVTHGGRVLTSEPAPRTRGTTVSVRSLFANVPARLASAARPQTEITQITQVVRRMALAAPQVRFALFVERRLALQTTGSGDLGTALIEVYGPSLRDRIVRLDPIVVAGATLSGALVGPEVTRPGRNQVHLIVNGRWVQPRGVLNVIEAAYRPVLPRGRHPIAVLTVAAPPDRIDPNIHPAKTEIRLRDDKLIAQELGAMVKRSLGTRPQSLQAPFRTSLPWLPPTPTLIKEDEDTNYGDDSPIETPGLPPLRLVGQVQNRLMLLEGEAGLFLVDQHRAHERILYEHLTATHGPGSNEPLPLPEPLVLELRPAQVAAFGNRLGDLAALGFQWEHFGGHTFLLRTAPELPGLFPGEPNADGSLHGIGEPETLLDAMRTLDDDSDEEDVSEGESWRERLLVRLSCRGAVRRGRPLSRGTMRTLVQALGATPTPAVCPHGSPLLVHVDGSLLEKQFGWD